MLHKDIQGSLSPAEIYSISFGHLQCLFRESEVITFDLASAETASIFNQFQQNFPEVIPNITGG